MTTDKKREASLESAIHTYRKAWEEEKEKVASLERVREAASMFADLQDEMERSRPEWRDRLLDELHEAYGRLSTQLANCEQAWQKGA